MIVLDEQLLGRDLDQTIGEWYHGTVQFVIDLRPNTIIKDDAIPQLLRQQNQPTFITINEKDFWRKVAIDKRFCVICFVLPDSRVAEIPPILRSLFNRPEFKSKANRMGKVVRIVGRKVSFYTFNERQVKQLSD